MISTADENQTVYLMKRKQRPIQFLNLQTLPPPSAAASSNVSATNESGSACQTVVKEPKTDLDEMRVEQADIEIAIVLSHEALGTTLSRRLALTQLRNQLKTLFM